MAFINNQNKHISYDCSALIDELAQDIKEFGSDLVVEVVVKNVDGTEIYKDYNFIEDDTPNNFTLKDGEYIKKMTTAALLECYKAELSIL